MDITTDVAMTPLQEKIAAVTGNTIMEDIIVKHKEIDKCNE